MGTGGNLVALRYAMPDDTPAKKSSVPSARRLGRERRRALEMLASSGQSGAAKAIMLAHGFPTKLLDGMVRDGLATEVIITVRAGNRMIAVPRLRIRPAGRKALEDA
jgi:hypothetical protein